MKEIETVFNTMEYGPAPESQEDVQAWLQVHKSGFKHYIDGKWVAPSGGQYFDSTNPATGDCLAKIAKGNQGDIDLAVTAAHSAHKKWSKLSGHQRARYLYALARAVQKKSRQLAVLESLDNGKPIRESRDIDIPLVARHFYAHAGWAQLLDSEFPEHQSIGVIGQIVPWNFPLLMAAWKIAPALAAGNCVILKPAEFTSLSAMMLAELLEEINLPAGVVNIVTGFGDCGEALVEHKKVSKIAFTGSTEVGRIIRQKTAGSGKKLTLELGGKSPFIVFDDADLDSAVEGVVDAIWFNQGEVCCAGSRLLVQENIAESFVAKIKLRMESLRVGDPLDKCTDIGAIVDPVQVKRISELVNQGVQEGASLWQPSAELPRQGSFYPPTLLCDVEPTNIVASEEIFGPVLSVTSFRTQAEAIDLANNTRYGLAASVWSESINRALDVAPQIKAGILWINCTNQMDAACGFGGYKESGFGREGGREGLFEYLKEKSIPVVSREPGAKRKKVKASKPAMPAIDTTAKHYIGGKQARADNGNTLLIDGCDGNPIGRVGDGNRKDIRNAVEQAHKASCWAKRDTHARAQILYYVAENLSYRRDEFVNRLESMTGATNTQAQKEFDDSIECLFTYAAWADKYEGRVHQPPLRGVTLAMNEPVGIIGICCPDNAPLLSFVSLWAPAVAMANRVVLVPSAKHPFAATDFYQILETSDMPAGVINIVTGDNAELGKVLAEHEQVDAVWYHGEDKQGSEMIEHASSHNLKRTWVSNGVVYDWAAFTPSQNQLLLRHSCEVKNIWIPYGD